MAITCLLSNLEGTSMNLSGAIKAFQIILEDMERDLLAQERTGLYLGPEHLLDCCDAMCTVTRELDRINEELDAIVTAAYTQKKEE